MRVVLVSTTDILGGAARGTYRLHLGLRRIGIDSHMYVMYQTGSDPHTHKLPSQAKALFNKGMARLEDRIFEQLCISPVYCPWSIQIAPRFFVDEVLALKPDIVHLNGVKGFVPMGALKRLGKPIVWTVVDMWPFTGGCHYSRDCEKFKSECQQCHLLKPNAPIDLANVIWRKKKKNLNRLNLSVAAISEWIRDCAKGSSVLGEFPVHLIHYGLDEQLYRPIDKAEARRLLGLDPSTRYIAFGADGGTGNPRKGFSYAIDAMKSLYSQGLTNLGLLIFGERKPDVIPKYPFPIRYVGALNDDVSLAITYSAANVMLVPSLQEGFGQTALEAMACGTPVVTFAGIGTCDVVTHRHNGFVAQYASSTDLAAGIDWCLRQDVDIAKRCRDAVMAEYTLEQQARRYQTLYTSLLKP